MKVVVNTRTHGLKFGKAEWDLVCSLGVRVPSVVDIRTHPVLVQLVEEGKLQGLAVVEIPDGTEYDVMTYDDRYGEYCQEHHSYHYSGEIVLRKGRCEWFPEGMGARSFHEEYEEV